MNSVSIKTKSNYRDLTAWGVLLVGMFSGYLDNPSILRYGLVAALFLLCTTNKKIQKALYGIKNGLFIFLFIFMIVIGINLALHGDSGSFGSNIRAISYGYCIILLVTLLTNVGDNGFSDFINNRIVFINVFGVINLIVLTIQEYIVHGFFIKESWLAVNSFYEDLCCGLFGYSATHEMTYFFCFWSLLNFYHALCRETNRTRKRKWIVYTIFLAIWMAVLSTQNDNVAFYGLYLLFVSLYFFRYFNIKYRWTTRTISKYMKILGLVAIIVLILFCTPSTRDFFVNTIFKRILLILSAKSTTANGSNERLAIVVYALKEGYGWGTGLGVGTHKWLGSSAEGGYLGFRHFGLNSISSFVTLGGMPFYILSVLFMSWIMWKNDLKKGNVQWMICIIIMVVISSVYTVIFTSYISAIWLALMVLVFSMTRTDMYKRNDNDATVFRHT